MWSCRFNLQDLEVCRAAGWDAPFKPGTRGTNGSARRLAQDYPWLKVVVGADPALGYAGASPYQPLPFPPFTFHRFYRMRVWWDCHNRLTAWLLAGLLGLFGACSRPSVPCTNVVSSEEISPSGKFKAVVFHRSCQEWVGSTVTTNVSILPANQSPGDGNGNVLSYKGEVGVRAGWLSEQRLAIYSFADLNDATRLDTVGGVTIEYPHMVDADIVRPAASPVPSVSSSATPPAEGAK